MSLINWVETLAPLIGGGVGFFTGGSAGAMLGTSMGSAVAGGLSLLEQPNVPQVSGEMKAQYATSRYLTSRLMTPQGLSETTYYRMRETAKQRALSQVGEMIGLAREMALTPLQLDALAKEVMQTRQTLAQETARVEDIDTEQIMANLRAAVSSQAQTNQLAAQMQQTQLQIENIRRQIEAQKAQAFARIIGGLAKAGEAYVSMKELQKQNTDNTATKNTTTNNILSQAQSPQISGYAIAQQSQQQTNSTLTRRAELDKAFEQTHDPYKKADILIDWIDTF